MSSWADAISNFHAQGEPPYTAPQIQDSSPSCQHGNIIIETEFSQKTAVGQHEGGTQPTFLPADAEGEPGGRVGVDDGHRRGAPLHPAQAEERGGNRGGQKAPAGGGGGRHAGVSHFFFFGHGPSIRDGSCFVFWQEYSPKLFCGIIFRYRF
jgi:hypothetical protein